MAAGRPPLGIVVIRSTDPPANLWVRLGAERVNVESGYGGWVEVARPRRAPITFWTGSPALRMTLPLLFDAYRAGTSLERQIATLERLATPNASDGAPARIRLVARGGIVPHQDRAWVIDSMEWGDGLVNRQGNRTRQAVTLSLLEYIADVRVKEKSPANLARARAAAAKTKAGAANKRVVAARGKAKKATSSLRATTNPDEDFGLGDDLLTIAARELGDADRWVEIAALNGLRDPRAIRPGQVLRLP